MAAFGIGYVFEKFSEASRLLATRTDPLNDKLYLAFQIFGPVGKDDIPEGEARDTYERMMSGLTAIPDEKLGSVRATTEKLHWTKARAIADDMYSLTLLLAETYYSLPPEKRL